MYKAINRHILVASSYLYNYKKQAQPNTIALPTYANGKKSGMDS